MKKATHLPSLILWISLFFLHPFWGLAAFIDAPTTDWTAITYAGVLPDAFADQQKGLEAGDLVGNAFHAALYTQFDDAGTSDTTDGTLAFRIRLRSVKNYSKMDYNYSLFVGINVDLDDAIDIFVGLNNNSQGLGNISIWDPGATANNSPSTTTINTSPLFTYSETDGSNYSFDLVDSTIDPAATTNDVDGAGKVDAFLSFSVDFGDLVSALSTNGFSITENSVFSYIAGTSTKDNEINLDINGINGGTTSTETFSTLGGYTDSYTATGVAVPEPMALGLIGVGGLFCLVIQRLNRRVVYTQKLPDQ